MNTKPRRVEFHKDDWVTKCEQQRVEIAALKNQIEQLRWRLERQSPLHTFCRAIARLASWLDRRAV